MDPDLFECSYYCVHKPLYFVNKNYTVYCTVLYILNIMLRCKQTWRTVMLYYTCIVYTVLDVHLYLLVSIPSSHLMTAVQYVRWKGGGLLHNQSVYLKNIPINISSSQIKAFSVRTESYCNKYCNPPGKLSFFLFYSFSYF